MSELNIKKRNSVSKELRETLRARAFNITKARDKRVVSELNARNRVSFAKFLLARAAHKLAEKRWESEQKSFRERMEKQVPKKHKGGISFSDGEGWRSERDDMPRFSASDDTRAVDEAIGALMLELQYGKISNLDDVFKRLEQLLS